MDRQCDNPFGSDCPLRYVCRCLRVTEAAVVTAVAARAARTLTDLRVHTGAGDGCRACHKRLARYLEPVALAAAS